MDDNRYAQASPDELPAVKALLERCGLPAADLTPAHLEHFILGRAGARIIGTVGLEPLGQVALLRSLAVEPNLRGRRVGHELWARARDHAAASGIRRLYLLTTTAEALFGRWGFHRVPRDQVPEIVRTTTQFSGMCPDTAVVMTRELG